jgi:hypothetical protein
MQELINRLAALWVKNGDTLEDFWKYERNIEEVITEEQEKLSAT